MKLATSALADQAAAATTRATGILANVAAADSGYRRRTQGPVTTAIVQPLAELAWHDQIGLCPHLSWTAPQPAFWCPWAPGQLRCAPCTETVQGLIRGTPEDRRCDHCRAIRRRIHAYRMQLPAFVADFDGPRCLPPVIAIFGLCCDCQDADTTTPEER